MRLSVIGFAATMGLLLPAGWRALDADRSGDGKLFRPDVQTVEIDGAKITVAVDEGVVASGQKVHVTLVASSEKRRKVPVVVSVEEQTGNPGDRVDSPPKTISRETIELDADKDGAKHTLSYQLDSHLGKPGGSRQYTILVESPKTVATLEKRRTRIARGGAENDDGSFYEAYEKVFEDHEAARVSVLARNPEAYHVSIDVPQNAKAGETFVATVHVKNPSKKSLGYVGVVLSPLPHNLYTMPGEGMLGGDGDYESMQIEAEGETSVDELGPGAEKTFTFKVTPRADLDHVALLASASSGDGWLAIGSVDATLAPSDAMAQAKNDATQHLW